MFCVLKHITAEIKRSSIKSKSKELFMFGHKNGYELGKQRVCYPVGYKKETH